MWFTASSAIFYRYANAGLSRGIPLIHPLVVTFFILPSFMSDKFENVPSHQWMHDILHQCCG